jgi:hypothetical protein
MTPSICCVLQSDYEARNYDVKKANGYWQLGRLGPEETEELQAKVGRVEGARTERWRASSTGARVQCERLRARLCCRHVAWKQDFCVRGGASAESALADVP